MRDCPQCAPDEKCAVCLVALDEVSGAASRASIALDELTAAIREARQAGMPLRDIAAAAGFSHEKVRSLTR